MLKAAERQYGVIEGFAQCLVDARQAGKVRHPLADLLGQRIFGIACGHPDGNDADRLGDDPIHKLLLGRDPVTGEALPRNRRSPASKTTWDAKSSMRWGVSWRPAVGTTGQRPPPTPRLRHIRRAATQQAGKVSSAGNEGLSAGIMGSLWDGVGRRTAARPSPLVSLY